MEVLAGRNKIRVSKDFENRILAIKQEFQKSGLDISNVMAADLAAGLPKPLVFKKRKKLYKFDLDNLSFGRMGQVQNIMFMSILLFFIVLVIGFCGMLLSGFNDSIQTSTFDASVKSAIGDIDDRYPVIFDNLFLLIYFGIFIFMIISSWLVDTYPVFLWITVLVLVMQVFVGATVSNMYGAVLASSGIGEFLASFPKIAYIFRHFVAISLIEAFVVIMVFFGKPK